MAKSLSQRQLDEVYRAMRDGMREVRVDLQLNSLRSQVDSLERDVSELRRRLAALEARRPA
jgi:polyhydroxyalkanoate synthesis regulator phasin